MRIQKAKQTGCIILTMIMLLVFAGCSGSNQQQEADHPFDFYIDLTTKEDIDDLSGESFVKGVFPYTLMIFQRPRYDNPQAGQIAVLMTHSFAGLDYSPINSSSLKTSDPAIMQDHEMNPILIDESLAKTEKLKVGDIFCQEAKVSDEPLKFTVAGIYFHFPLFAQFEAVALINDQILSVFSDIVDELGYTNAYVKASDITALKTYLDEVFVPHLQLEGLSEEEIAAIPEEDLKAYYEEYEAHMNRMN